ncbi:MAG TPA: GAF domain-containing SpoIIE family protein phosphatase [Streptosporangiaceae bacterium]|nr:GAF domain-containing SpoIIE family protein phosphatase [Streptosporangiaceae bacterium]
MESRIARDGAPDLPRRREPDLADLATFTLDQAGRVISWSVTATRLFGHPARAVVGRDVCEVLMSGPGQRRMMRDALAEAAAGRVWTATMAGGYLGDGRFAIRCEPLAGPGSEALVIARRAWPQPGPSWLSDAAARIGSTLDLTQTASEVVDVAVPGFADAAAIYGTERLLVADELTAPSAAHGAVVRRLAARLAGQDEALAGRLLPPGEVLVFGPDTPYLRAMVAGSPVRFDQLDGETAGRIARRPGGDVITSSYTSFLAVPLIARGAVVGCITFGRGPARPAFAGEDVSLAGELASRAAVCIDNARLYHRERRTALALQQGLLPGQPQVPAGMEVAHRYLPVGASVVGGDWHDIVPLAGGRAALIVGDAMGHGPEAAAVMVQLRTAAHTLADLELPPGQVLCRLDKMAAGMPAAPFATCIATVIDPARSSCAAAQAGHLPPVLVLPDGTTRVLDLPPGLPLGLGAESFEVTQISLPPGATLALYTDGLVEGRARSLDDGLAALREALSAALAEPGATLGSACERVTQKLRQHGEDDITLVLARVRQCGPGYRHGRRATR